MITFLTLYLGLLVGPRDFELAVGETVARVDVLLDGELHTRITAPPWEFRIDLGAAPLPHELTAVAYDRQGEAVGRAFQRLNLPRPPVEVAIALEGEAGRVEAARLVWAAVADEALTGVRVRLDGRRIPVDDPSHIPLPPLDLTRTHHLSAEVTFRRRLRTQAAVVFGGAFVDRVDSELTAVAVEELRAGAEEQVPTPAQAAGWFHRRGTPLAVFAVERPPAEVMLVRDRASARTLLRFVGSLRATPGTRVEPGSPWWATGTSGARARLLELHAERLGIGLGDDDWLRFMATQPQRRPESRNVIFEASGDVLPVARGLGLGVAALRVASDDRAERLADAVAASALEVAGGGRQRAVLLVVDPGTSDGSLLTPEQAKQYLTAMRVPLEVWTAGDPEAVRRVWGAARDVSKPRRLAEAVAALERRLDRQLVIWLEGRLLPHEIELTPEGQRHVAWSADAARGVEAEDRALQDPVGLGDSVQSRVDAPCPVGPLAVLPGMFL